MNKNKLTEEMKDRLGQCYTLAGRYVLAHPDAILVHGAINGRRWGIQQEDNPHAWVEEGDEVYDLVWDQRFPKDAYYSMMQAIESIQWNKWERQCLKQSIGGRGRM